MMLSRPSVSIRRFISQRRAQDENDDGVIVGTGLEFKAVRKDVGTFKRRPYGNKKRPPPPIIVSREQSIHDILDPLPPLPSYETPRSSASSFNSCERHNDSRLSQSIDSKRSRSPLCSSISSKEHPSEESLQLSSTTSYGGDDSPPKPPPKGHPRSSESLRRDAELLVSHFDHIEALSLRPENKATTSKPQARQPESFASFSDDIQQLIQEADEAFRAVGSALAEVQIPAAQAAAAEVQNIEVQQQQQQQQRVIETTFKELPKLPTPDSSPILKPAPLPYQNRMHHSPFQTNLSSSTSTSTSTPTHTHTPPRIASSTSSSGVKRKKSKSKAGKTKSMKPQRKPAAANTTTTKSAAARSGPRWGLSENVMTELFSGKFFGRVEVDEMLTPSQLEAYKLRRMSIMQSAERSSTSSSSAAEKSTETLDTECSDTPVEPFHLDDLPSRIGSAGVDLVDVETPIAEKRATSLLEAVVRRDFASEPHEEEHNNNDNNNNNNSSSSNNSNNNSSTISEAAQTDIGEEPAEYGSATFPTPPMRHPARYNRRSRKTSLPSIPETTAVSTPQDAIFGGQAFTSSRDIVADSNYVFLQSSPCSVTTPRFRHGPIRLAKCGLIADLKVGADEGLDWTAFQMAISGGAGDWLSESDDTIRRREAEEVDELGDWFDSWNFSNAGGLVTSRDFVVVDMPSPTSSASGEDYSDLSCAEVEGDNAQYSYEEEWPQLRPRANGHRLDAMSGLEIDTSKMLPDEEDDDDNHAFTGRESYASLPQSPMLDLRVVRTPDGDDVDVVPMGYNLGHDLGDFLKWEAEHAYAGDFN
ncbi:hypothetical protein M426DRAFT_11633 [Hypoxylon sp. CI-4A]|nr:hypothetical protein M426DRAFT_11633 [Hypoxylon sp. CI-4A]